MRGKEQQLENDIVGLQESIEKLQAALKEKSRAMTELNNEKIKQKAAAQKEVEAYVVEKQKEAKHQMSLLVERHGVAKERMNTMQIIDSHKTKARRAKHEWESFQIVRDNLRDLQRELLKGFNIPGIEIGDDVTYEGVAWDQVNTAQRVAIAVKVAVHRGAKVIMVDRAESLDSETVEALSQECDREGVQLWMLAVTEDNEIVVNTKDYMPF